MLKQQDINSYKNELQPKPQPYITVNSKQIIDLSVIHNVIKKKKLLYYNTDTREYYCLKRNEILIHATDA